MSRWWGCCNVAAMCETVVPIFNLFYWQGGEAAWGLISSVAVAVSAAIATAVAAATADVATNIRAAAVTTAIVAATVAAAATVATAVVATPLLPTATFTPWASWLLMWGLAGANCLAEHLLLPLNFQDVGSVQS
jgi:hypothetical protein